MAIHPQVANGRRVERLKDELHALTEVAKTLTSPLELPGLLGVILDRIVEVLQPAQIGAIMLWDQAAGVFRPQAAFGYDLTALRQIGLQAGESVTGKVFDGGEALLLGSPEAVTQAMQDMRPANRDVMARAIGSDALPICTLAAPISSGKQKFGVLVLETLEGPPVFTEDDLPFVQTIADLIALLIDRDRLAAQADSARQTRQAERMRAEILATLSHELRMPLAAIQGYSTALLLEEVQWSDEKGRQFLRLIEQECHNMETMLRDILDSSLIEVDQFFIEVQPTRLQHLAREAAAEIQRRSDAHRILVDFPADFPILEIDSRWIKQVFRNLLDNAVKYSPEGGLIVVRGEERVGDVVVEIADQGMGISSEDLIPLFERYFRVRSAANLHIPGTGLGLPIARAVLEAHGGRIWAESKLGEGTRIYFSLPKTGNPG
jgi:K+-sensing histidine kinase KdpD